MSDQAPKITPVIGLEVHVQLQTESKLFCRCATRFGQPANTLTCPVCIGLPGTLPVLNRRAVELSVTTGLALNCRINRRTKWDRKNYFYPDLPKGYQISQFDLPIAIGGWLDISSPKNEFAPKRVRITRAHLEEDAGKSMHDEQSGVADSKIDLNRAGTPLLEIVSEPDMNSPAEAKAYLNELKLLLTYLAVSDCNMQEGSLRVDANINLHVKEKADSTDYAATPIVEVKNMNSFRAVERALAYEIERQMGEWFATGKRIGDVPKQTRMWNDGAQQTFTIRTKEEASDYRYFPDPDLVDVELQESELNQVRSALCELPQNLRARLETQYGITAYDADVIVNQGRATVIYFEAVAQSLNDGKLASNWIQQNVLRVLNEQSQSIEQFTVTADRLIELLSLVKTGRLDNTRAKELFGQMLTDESSVVVLMTRMGIVEVSANELEDICRSLLSAQPAAIEAYRAGKTQALGAIIGQAKKKNPNVNPEQVRLKLIELIQQA
jgi:aspartyl-tRNA(Asn)/glutamyl-tRNA(Gln) amidotransferase subunit B